MGAFRSRSAGALGATEDTESPLVVPSRAGANYGTTTATFTLCVIPLALCADNHAVHLWSAAREFLGAAGIGVDALAPKGHLRRAKKPGKTNTN